LVSNNQGKDEVNNFYDCIDQTFAGQQEVDNEDKKQKFFLQWLKKEMNFNKNEIKIEDIVENKMNVRVRTHTGKLKKIKKHKKIETTKPMVRIVLEDGAIECTEDHKILTPDGWKEAKDLLPGKDVVYKYAKEKGNI